MERREGQQESARLAEWLLQIDRETIYAFVQRGLIPHSRIEANVVAGISKVSKCLAIDRNPVTDMGIQEVLSTPTDVDAELEQLTVDAGCTPTWILVAHPTDQVSELVPFDASVSTM